LELLAQDLMKQTPPLVETMKLSWEALLEDPLELWKIRQGQRCSDRQELGLGALVERWVEAEQQVEVREQVP
jgi:hypothetical protein